MYLEHFGLSEVPFRITPHTDFFFAGANRGATLEALMYAITHDEGIVKVSGEVGSGKTMLCRVLMERLPAHVSIVYLANPSLARDDILYAIADELELEIPEHTRLATMLRILQDHLIELYAEDRQVVVLIDEAHAMPAETLEEIRLLSNLESNRHKLMQLVLFGQPELNEVLSRPDMRQLKERITHNFALEPLVREDIAEYLDFRMRAAGYKGPSIFAPAAIREIARASLGLTRRVNILADKALLAAYSQNTHQITARHVKAAVADSEFGTMPRADRTAWIAAAATVVLVVAGAGVFWSQQGAPPTPVAIPPAPAPAAAPIPAAAPAPTPTAVAPPAAPAAPAAPQSAPTMASPSNPVTAAPTNAASQPPALSAAPAAPPVPPVPPAPVAWQKLPQAVQKRLAEHRSWFEKTPNDRWFIQLLGTDSSQARRIEALLARADALLDPAQVRVYFVPLHGSERMGVIYGDFPSRAAAVEALKTLPTELRPYQPYPRQVVKLR
ncbi:ExeA family protein [Sulfurisoma sediminicola]|uniref:Type II secretory pathway predicted ATPase ExeA n=1 Tax=Sulfurisoma sediminicola TaxID=1381557 RepID=A0A497XBN8_9PROT|nr:AAA family ATPase [Sulfurisoma sediminicola]RLJ63743.1 type II secretory pathway predicted ATPase ExeA [Sulfurisoma sediminicola]